MGIEGNRCGITDARPVTSLPLTKEYAGIPQQTTGKPNGKLIMGIAKCTPSPRPT